MSQRLALSPSRCSGSRCSARRPASSTRHEARTLFIELESLSAAARPAEHRVGPAAARAEHLVGHGFVERVARQAAAGAAAAGRGEDRHAMRRRSDGADIRRGRFRLRARFVVAVLAVAGVLLARARCSCRCSTSSSSRAGRHALHARREDPAHRGAIVGPLRRAAGRQQPGGHRLRQSAELRRRPTRSRGSPRPQARPRVAARSASPATSTASSSTSPPHGPAEAQAVRALGIPGVHLSASTGATTRAAR
jgi:hypothetical protein